jgi:hypothetical protein
MMDFVEWKPKQHGEKPPYWKSEMPWAISPAVPATASREPVWLAGTIYSVPSDAVQAPPVVHVDRIETLTAENERLREALREIASDDFGLQGLIEDGVYEETETSRYYAALVSWRRKRALAALEKQP